VDASTGVAYVGRQDGALTLLATRTGRVLRALPASMGRPGAVVGGPGSVSMLDAHTGRLLRTVLRLLLPLHRRTPLVLFSPPVRREAPRLVHRQNRGYQQHQQGDTGVEQRGWAPQLADIGPGRCHHGGDDGAK
jgi:hypothetical protein